MAAAGHRSIRLTLILSFTQCLPFVVVALALGEGDLDLRFPVGEVDREWNEGVPTLFRAVAELDELLFVQQQFSFAARGVVGPRPLRVLGDVHRIKPQFTALKEGVSVNKRGTSGAQRFHLGANEHDTGFVRILYGIVVAGFPIRRDDRSASFPGHDLLLGSERVDTVRDGPTEAS